MTKRRRVTSDVIGRQAAESLTDFGAPRNERVELRYQNERSTTAIFSTSNCQ
jgi:hypothetical protein